MKKNISVLLSVLLIVCVLFSGCSNNNSQGGNNNNNQSNGNNSQDNGTESDSNNESEIKTIDNRVAIDEKYFPKHIKTIELTKENWKEYLELIREEKTDTYADAFGEVTSTRSYVCYTLKIKDMGQFTCGFSHATIEVIDPRDGKMIYFRPGFPYYYLDLEEEYSTDTTYTIDNFECTRIKGEIILIVDIPQEVIKTDDEGREFFFAWCEVNGRNDNMRFNNYRNKKDDGISSKDVEVFLD